MSLTGKNVWKEMSSWILAILTPLSSIFLNNSGVKCNPAVGAAKEPSFFA